LPCSKTSTELIAWSIRFQSLNLIILDITVMVGYGLVVEKILYS